MSDRYKLLPKFIRKKELRDQLTIREVDDQRPNKIAKTKFRKSEYIPSAVRKDAGVATDGK